MSTAGCRARPSDACRGNSAVATFRGAGCTESGAPGSGERRLGMSADALASTPDHDQHEPARHRKEGDQQLSREPARPGLGDRHGHRVVVGATVGSAAEVVGSSPPQPSSSGPARVPPRSPTRLSAAAAVVVGATSGHGGACGNVMANVASVGLTHVQPAGSSTGGGAPCGRGQGHPDRQSRPGRRPTPPTRTRRGRWR